VAIPIGVPAVFLFLMNRARLKLPGGKVNTTLLGGAKLVPETMEDDQDSYGFLCRDCRPEFWYYEIVTYARKLILGGLTISVGRGTMAQNYLVAACEAAFLMHHMRVYPYVRRQHNLGDAIGHFILILTYTIALILRNNEGEFANESFPKEGYGWVLLFLYAIVLPAPTIYYFCHNASDEKTNRSRGEWDVSDETGFVDNPLGDDDPSGGSDDGDGEMAENSSATRGNSGIAVHKLARVQRQVRETIAENQELKKQNADLLAKAAAANVDRGAITVAKMPAMDAPAPEPAAPKLTAEEVKITKWKEIAEDEYLTEETRAAAKENIEQTHALALALAKAATAKDFERKEVQVEAALAPSAAARQHLRNWLGKHRLLHHESKLAEVCGPYVAVEDLPLLDQEDLDAITSAMTKLEASRFVAASKAQVEPQQ
jgi:hypothetical protein